MPATIRPRPTHAALALLAALAAPAHAQWTLRADRDAPTDKVTWAAEGPGYAITTGPSVIAYDKSATATGKYRVSATFTQRKAPRHPEGYGLILGGRKLDQKEQDYLYFLVRADGSVLVKHRGGEAVHTLMDWKKDAAVQVADAKGVAVNELAVEAENGAARFFVNGKPVGELKSGYLNADGIVGYRVNHGLDLAVSKITVTPRK